MNVGLGGAEEAHPVVKVDPRLAGEERAAVQQRARLLRAAVDSCLHSPRVCGGVAAGGRSPRQLRWAEAGRPGLASIAVTPASTHALRSGAGSHLRCGPHRCATRSSTSLGTPRCRPRGTPPCLRRTIHGSRAGAVGWRAVIMLRGAAGAVCKLAAARALPGRQVAARTTTDHCTCHTRASATGWGACRYGGLAAPRLHRVNPPVPKASQAAWRSPSPMKKGSVREGARLGCFVRVSVTPGSSRMRVKAPAGAGRRQAAAG